ncbi:hypothetical protein P3T36_003897 [Kitasatospora sp. MAP12-15]|uniref:protein phosphatase 2C domain-containing protein n=1 Tax=unclassified Kitasatospora TaxID=2633591 RepID=UPI002475FF56|nr:protein phosphatase 2C domain-containing protein [Kitasatospora sp. MAP12-44]MDH6108459.1 hypothetical protein [Kitasatospora sp. MAP12-44]
MNITSATLAARSDAPNLDLLLTGPDVVVLLDGAGGPSAEGSGCLHGVHWYVRQLGSRLLSALLTTEQPPAELLARAIEAVADLHRSSCDLRNPATPSSTVAIVRRREDVLDYLTLHDSTILLTRHDRTRAVSDRRLHGIPELRHRREQMSHLPLGGNLHAVARRAYIAHELTYRNTPGGYWVAGADPRSAAEAVSATVTAKGLRAVSLLSDGAGDYVDVYRLADWPQVAGLLERDGPARLVQLVRAAERGDPSGRVWPRLKTHDDATAAHWSPT